VSSQTSLNTLLGLELTGKKKRSFTLGYQEFRDVMDKLLNREAGERLYEWRSDLSQKSKSEL
jgi:hypothetical protein